MLELAPKFAYFAALDPFSDEDLRDYLSDPIAALPPAVIKQLPRVEVLLVPYLERSNGGAAGDKKNGKGEKKHGVVVKTRVRRTPTTAAEAALPPEGIVLFDRPPDGRSWRGVHWLEGTGDKAKAILALATGETEVADYHYQLYRHLSMLVAELTPPEQIAPYLGVIREELNSHMHGEVDERSWQLKQSFLRHRSQVRRDSKEFREYALQSFVDTLTLYLHGICCDIDVETGPRQLPSRHLRRRLRLLRDQFAPPSGYAVFPEELDRNTNAPVAPVRED